MSDILTKTGVPGSVAVPGTPGTPGYPGNPAYCVTTQVSVPTWKIIYNGSPPPPPPPYYNGYDGSWNVVFAGYVLQDHTTCYPAQLATPPVPGIAPQSATKYDFNIGWNSGAVSIGSMPGDGEYQFSINNPVVGVVSGLSQSDVGGRYQNIEFGLYFAGNQFQVVESGVQKNAYTTFTSTDIFTISRIGTQVRYWKNSTLIYTSLGSAIGTVYADAAMYMAGDAINNAVLGAIEFTYTGVLATCAAILQQPISFSLAGGADLGGWANDIIGPPIGAATGTVPNTTAAVLQQPVGQSFANGFVEDCEGVLTQPIGYAESGLLAPQYAIASCLLQSPSGFSWAYATPVANAAGVLTQPISFSLAGGANLGGWEDYGTLPQPVGFASTGALPNYFIGYAGNYSIYATGYQNYGVTYGFNGTLSLPYTVSGYGGAYARMTLSHCTLLASGTLTTLGEATLALSGYQMLATGTGVILGRAYLAFSGDYAIAGQFGGTARIATLGGYTINGHAFGGALGEARLKVRHCTLQASGTQGNYGIVSAILPSVIMAPEGEIRIHGPHFTIIAHGYNTSAPTYEAYSHTLMGDEKEVTGVAVTHYTNYPFDRIMRFNGKYYGAGADGLFELTGNLFDTTPIVSVVQTGESDLSEPSLKRTRHLYMSGRLSQDIGVSVIARENETDTYTYDPVLGGARNTRVTLGRGIQARYLAFKFTNLDGQDFELHELAPEVDVLRRSA